MMNKGKNSHKKRARKRGGLYSMNKLPKSLAKIKTCLCRKGTLLVKFQRTKLIFELLPTPN